MGLSVKFNWVLQIEPPELLEVARSYPFEKSGNRVFPIETPIDLIDLNRNAIAKIKITACSNDAKSTSGTFYIIKIYTGIEKSILTNYWVENE